MTRPLPSLYLVTPRLHEPAGFRASLEEACAAAQLTAVLFRFPLTDERTLIRHIKAIAPVAQARGVAVIIEDPGPEVDLAAVVTRSGADGAHSASLARLRDLCERLKDGRNIGAGGLRTKHDAMVAGEIGVDYVMFGEPRPDGSLPPFDLVCERAGWWAEIFQTPCVVYAPTLDGVTLLGATGAEFVALGEAVWDHADGPAAALSAAVRRLPAALPGDAA